MGVIMHFNTKLEAFVGDGPASAPSRPPGRAAGRPRGRLHAQAAQQHARRALGWRPDPPAADRRRADGDLAAGVYAAGDCIEIPHGVTNVPVQGLSGSHAYAQGKVAGANAAGGNRATSRSTSRGAWSPASG